MESDKQKTIGCLTIGGGAMFVFGLVAFFMMVSGGAAAAAKQGNPSMLLLSGLPLGLCLLGAIACGYGLYIGYKAAFSNDAEAPVVESRNAYVIACFVLDNHGEKVYDPDMFDDDEIKHYVQVELADGTKKEFRTAESVYNGIGEGQRGTVTYQGNWLSRFEFTPTPE